MSKTYRITSEVVNFSLVTPDNTPFEKAVEEAKQVFLSLKESYLRALQNPMEARIALVTDEDEDVLGHLLADYYRDLEQESDRLARVCLSGN